MYTAITPRTHPLIFIIYHHNRPDVVCALILVLCAAGRDWKLTLNNAAAKLRDVSCIRTCRLSMGAWVAHRVDGMINARQLNVSKRNFRR